MQIVYLSSEVVPFSKTGGLADVAGALPDALAALGHEVAVITPLYRCVRERDLPLELVLPELQVPAGGDGATLRARLHRSRRQGEATVYLLEHDPSFDREGLYGEGGQEYEDSCERFALYARGALAALPALGLRPDIVHANDWQAALAVCHLHLARRAAPPTCAPRTLLTIHNLAYQGLFAAERMAATGLPQECFNWQELEFHGQLNLLKGGMVHADALSTVSRRYAQEIQTPEHGVGLEGVLTERAGVLHGIPNGIDVDIWNPALDPHLPATYDLGRLEGKATCKAALQGEAGLPVEPGVQLVALVGRLAEQKGIDLLLGCLQEVLQLPLQLVILGTGDPQYEEQLRSAESRHPGQVRAWIRFDEGLAHRIEAGADAFLMPSRYEPCGLNQLYSMRYGTIPVVRATGGLADTVVDASTEALAAGTATGVCFDDPTPAALGEALRRAHALYHEGAPWEQLMRAGMLQDFSWDARAREYVELYGTMLGWGAAPARSPGAPELRKGEPDDLPGPRA